MLVILNDNQMSIGHNTGGLATCFAKIWASKTPRYAGLEKILGHVRGAWDLAKTEEHMKGMVAPGAVRGTWLALYQPPRRTRSAANSALNVMAELTDLNSCISVL